MKIFAKITGRNKLRAELERKADKVTAEAEQAIKLGTFRIHADAVKAVQNGPKSGLIYGKHQASAPGEAPASDTGNLASNIVLDIIKESGRALGIVVSRAIYSVALEFGTRTMEARPFMRPAADKHIPEVKKQIRDSIKRALRDG